MVATTDIGVIIPTYYRNELLAETLRSIRNQTITPQEIIVVDDSGTGHAEDICLPYEEITYLSLTENSGPQIAREIGLQHSEARYVQFLDDDDRLREDAMEKRISVLNSNGDLGVVYSGIWWDNGRIDRPRRADTNDILAAALAFDIAGCTTSNMLFDRSYIDPVRPLTGKYTGAGDLALSIWLADRTEFEFVHEPLLLARGAHDSLGVSWDAIKSRFAIIEDFSELYDRYPSTVKRRALADTYALEGRRHLRNRRWSASAIRTFARAAYHEPGISPFRMGEFLSSIGGRPTRTLASRVATLSRSDEESTREAVG